jgi:hypothetical protein
LLRRHRHKGAAASFFTPAAADAAALSQTD